MSQVGLQTFLPSTVVAAFALSLESANFLLTALLLASALGIVAGGIVADRFRRHELIVAVGLGVAAAASLACLSGPLPLPALMLLRRHCRLRDGRDDAGARHAGARRRPAR